MEDLKNNSAKWVMDPAHSELTFKVRHMMISNVKGEFKNFSAEIDHEEFDKGSVNVNVETSSVSTNNNDRDNHLKSADFFDAENHPAMTFKSTGLKLSLIHI